jgi:hypothetical protein
MLEATWRTGTRREDVVVTGPNVSHLGVGDRSIVQWSGPIRPALEYRQLGDLVRDLRNNLDGRGAGTDNCDLLARHLDRLVRPVERMERTALEFLHAVESRRRRYGKQADCHNDETAGQLSTAADPHTPHVIGFVEVRRLDLAIELHVFAQIELVRDVVQVAEVLRLTGEPFFPVPFIQQFFGERVAVSVTFRVEPGTRIAVRVPGPAKIVRGFEHRGVSPQVGQHLDLIDSGHTGADDDCLVVRFGPFDHDLLQFLFIAQTATR